jgi:hypothetical protein
MLSRSYTGPAMVFQGVTIAYSALANEILREFQTAFFCGEGKGDQTQYHGICESILVMWNLAREQYDEIERFRQMPRTERHAEVLSFAIRYADEIESLHPQIVSRVESAMAAAVESEGAGKSQPQAHASSP